MFKLRLIFNDYHNNNNYINSMYYYNNYTFINILTDI